MKFVAVLTFLALLALSAVARRHFDSIYYICPTVAQADGTKNISYTCPPNPNDKHMCMCRYDFDRLNSAPGHYLMGGPPQWIPDIFSAGNTWTWQEDQISDGFPGSGAAYADKIYAKAKNFADFAHVAVPRYFFLNELSFKRWTQNRPGYHQYIYDMVKQLKSRQVVPVVFAPFMNPKLYKSSWLKLKSVGAYVAIEAYLDSAKIAKISTNAKRYEWMLKQYQDSVADFVKMGTPRNHLLIFEHFGTTPKGKHYGRGAVSDALWKTIIALRAKAFKALKLFGTGGYGWIGNGMNLSNEFRKVYYDYYLKHTANLP